MNLRKNAPTILNIILVLATAQTRNAYAERVTPPPVPEAIKVEQGFKPFLAGHATGTQGYVCVAVNGVYSWAPFGPQATLYNSDGQQTMTHFLSVTPYSELLNPAWQHSRDSSIVWAQPIASSTDPNFVAGDAIPWLLLQAVVVGDGDVGGEKLLATRYIQRLNTVGGQAPTTGCAVPGDIKKRTLVPYEADYFFFKERVRTLYGEDRDND